MELISSLDDLYFYQNNTTGKASSTAVSIRQLCKILSNQTTHVTPDTLVWSASSPESQWKALRDIPILKESCAQWYYTTNDSNATLGPVSVKQLHRLEDQVVMVYSSDMADKGWFRIADHPDMALAIRAFDHEALPPVIVESENLTMAQTKTGALSDNVAESTDEVQQELEAFLRSAGAASDPQHEDGDDDEAYQSDGGTNYLKDPSSGKWIHEALVPKKPIPRTDNSASQRIVQEQKQPETDAPNKKKRTRAKFSARNAKCWVYVSGLPLDTNEEEVQHVFSRAGILDLDPDSQKPKIKLYSTMEGKQRILKGDASLCFARPESIDLCIQLFHEAPFRLDNPTAIITVERAKFEQRGESYQKKAQSWQKRLVAKKAALQSIGWEDNEDNGRITGGIKGLTIVVLKHVFTTKQAQDDSFLEELERKIRTECSAWGTVTKITIFASNPNGIVLVRFKEPTAATTAIENLNGRIEGDTKIEAHFWDGVTDYTVKDVDQERHQEEARLEEFGDWLESQEELPDELQLQVESS
ncbi:hypothetical protein MHU86_14055 [Fragilaria crotonensis]|nr:hypothetical protein MHU86_14055 [Fragilaria crotonensis]